MMRADTVVPRGIIVAPR